MLAVNGRAKEELKKLLSARAEDPQVVVRLMPGRPGEFGLWLDLEMPHDRVVEHEGLKVLLVDSELDDSLEDYTLAFEDKKFVMAKGPLSGFNKSVVAFHGKSSE